MVQAQGRGYGRIFTRSLLVHLLSSFVARTSLSRCVLKWISLFFIRVIRLCGLCLRSYGFGALFHAELVCCLLVTWALVSLLFRWALTCFTACFFAPFPSVHAALLRPRTSQCHSCRLRLVCPSCSQGYGVCTSERLVLWSW